VPPAGSGLTLARDASTDPGVVGYRMHVGPARHLHVNLPEGLSLNPATGAVSGAPARRAAGDHTVTVTVTDGAQSASRSFTWIVLRGWSWGRVR